ncbi:hypothetical protein LCGC14_1233570 [marine sediment metagenome]|uniref:Uncharacterized protein n=1 Tax=marine sediment metagenome TaxID=412755 RepID=A0A0F9PC39_9ZZZZ
MTLFNPFKWIDDKLSVEYIPKPPTFRHVVRPGIYSDSGLVVQEYISSVGVEGAIYYKDLPRLVDALYRVIEKNRDICFPD